MGRKAQAIVIDRRDNVATALEGLDAGAMVPVLLDGKTREVKILSDIPKGHKFALKDLKKGQPILKYGEPIGESKAAIRAGEHVHVHNVTSGGRAG